VSAARPTDEYVLLSIVELYFCIVIRRTTIEIDEELLARAQQALGTRGLKDTVDAALDEAVRRMRRERVVELVRSGQGIDRSPELLDRTRPLR
jgi:Arc/MetJ family transcription regulator